MDKLLNKILFMNDRLYKSFMLKFTEVLTENIRHMISNKLMLGCIESRCYIEPILMFIALQNFIFLPAIFNFL